MLLYRPRQSPRLQHTMKIIELTNASPDIASLLDQARVDDIVVRMADGSEFLLVAVDDFDREIARTRANPRLMALLESRAKQTTTVSLEEAKPGTVGLGRRKGVRNRKRFPSTNVPEVGSRHLICS